ncbi:hypothetical protein [Pseudomonas aeruginosa]|uniref:hypothetical protein n=1 Tax=Pseudomonas aeruginosa TaxID=287 RepID=UPI00068B4BB5|nr:hypothetical protein [Pseudomonas aeruginosa]
MATANVIPLNAEGTAPRHSMPLCTVLTPELAEGLRLTNDMARRLRAAGIRVESTSPLDSSLFIAATDAALFAELFRKEWRGVAWSTAGQHTRNSVYLDGVRIAWLTPVKEQEQ